jgi:hypothetical protein
MSRRSRPLSSGVAPTSPLRARIDAGISALSTQDRSLLHAEVRVRFSESLDLDSALQSQYPNDHRWDYLLGDSHTSSIVAIEPHTADTKEVSEVIKKKRAALQHLSGHLNPNTRVRKWIWVTRGTVRIVPFDKARLRLDQEGITLAGRCVTTKHLT